MHSQQQKRNHKDSKVRKDYEPSPPQCAELDYLDIHSQSGDMRYTQDSSSSTLAIEPNQPPALLNLFHPSSLGTTTQYSQDGAAFYQPAPHVFPGLDVRSRLGSSTTSSSTGMAHAHSHQQHHRTPGLPHSAASISARDQYSAATPSFRRGIEHPIRSPSFPSAPLRRHPLTPTPSPLTGFANPVGRMDANQYQNRAAPATVPPLLSVQTTGSLQYPDGTPIKVEITGTVDKGFFLAEGEWTCYRRNYMACNCSYSLQPHWTGATIQYVPSGSEHPYQVYGFSMCISAVVADNDQHSIELVQHTPKRDKGPISKPEKVPLAPKNSVPSHHAGLYSESSAASGARSVYSDGFGNAQASGHPATEHTFERIQFKQATQNNGRRRAAQQYYHLMVELWADLGTQTSEKFVKVAYRKSEKMIVRGRSPGHYQNGKGRSHSSGPGGSAGNIGYSNINDLTNFPTTSIVAPSGGYATSSYETTRSAMYGGTRHHDLTTTDATMSSEDEKAVGSSKNYSYYTGALYDPAPAPRLDMFSHHHRSEGESSGSHLAAAADNKIKSEYDLNIMPRVFHPPPMADLRRQNGPFDKATSSGYYHTMMTPPGANLTMP